MAVLLKLCDSESIPRGTGQTPLSDRTIQLLGYTLFFWVTTFLTPPYLEQPDILVLIIFLLTSALCMQLTLSPSAQLAWRYALFGIVLGLSYLLKAVMFPLSFAFIAALFFTKDRFRRLPAILLAAAVFIAVSAPFIYTLSRSKGHLTYGDAGAVNCLHIMGTMPTSPPARSLFPRASAASGRAAHLRIPQQDRPGHLSSLDRSFLRLQRHTSASPSRAPNQSHSCCAELLL